MSPFPAPVPPQTAPAFGPAPTIPEAAPAPAFTPTVVQRAPDEAPSNERRPQSNTAAAPAASGHQDGELWPHRPADDELERLAKWLYPLISYRIRGELREGRERAGMLTDSYGRW